MDIRTEAADIRTIEADAIVVNLFEGVTEPGGATGAVDQALGGQIRSLIQAGDFSGKADSTLLIYAQEALGAPRVLVVGLGKREEFDLHAVRRASAVAARSLARLGSVKRMATIVHGAGVGGLDAAAAAQAVAEGTLMATYIPIHYRRNQETSSLTVCTVVESNQDRLDDVNMGAQRGEIIGRAVNRARNLVQEPANVLTPAELAQRARRMAEEVGLQVTVLGEAALRKLEMNLILAVSQGSEQEAHLLILEHAPEGHEEDPPLILAGKGITFDTGGVSLKRSAEMWRMKNDMGGAAAVIGAMEAIGRLGLPRRVIGITPCVENMADGRAYRPGDVLTGITGKTTEIISTDAEGRLILADTLGYIARFEPEAVVDLATLTGAVGIALGKNVRAAVFANDDKLKDDLMAASRRSGEGLWPMPLDEEYKAAIKSNVAEVKNSGGLGGGLGTSAKFLEHFTEGYRWAHLDIANMVWSDSAGADSPAGPTGYGVRLLVELAAGS